MNNEEVSKVDKTIDEIIAAAHEKCEEKKKEESKLAYAKEVFKHMKTSNKHICDEDGCVYHSSLLDELDKQEDEQ